MRRSTLILLFMTWPFELCAQSATDTTITVSGIVQAAAKGPSHWGLFLPAPVVVRGVRIGWLSIEGDPHGIDNHQDRFVEATGTLRVGTDSTGAVVAALVDPRAKERDPSGIVRQSVQLSFTQRAVVTLALEPSRFGWRDSAGSPSGVRPMLLFSLVNHGDVPIQMSFPRYEVICVRVRAVEAGLADTSWTILMPGVRNISLVMRQRFAEIIELPPGAARKPGRYRTRVELCSGSAYGADVFFEVIR